MDDINNAVFHTPWIDKLLALIEVLLLSGLVSSILASLPFTAFGAKKTQLLLNNANFIAAFVLIEAGITFVLLAVVLKIRQETLPSIGLHWRRWKSQLFIGLASTPFLFLASGAVIFVFKVFLPKYFVELNPLTETIHTPLQLVFFIFAAIVAGGIKEELQRAFILTRFRLHLGGAGLGLILWSLVFGAGHYMQGLQGIVTAVIFGLIFGVIYILNRCILAPIIAHSAYDILALLAYWFSQASHN
jgi:membrane protease YdiL (CAAX protease family)